jgi:hypothetical protein
MRRGGAPGPAPSRNIGTCAGRSRSGAPLSDITYTDSQSKQAVSAMHLFLRCVILATPSSGIICTKSTVVPAALLAPLPKEGR